MSVVLHKGSVYRLASKEIFYHGTASGENDWLLKRILKEGLIPDPKERVWSGKKDRDPDDYAYWQDREKESLGGVYFSTDPKRISTYMLTAMQTLGGEEVAVIAQLETRSPEITLDEEALFGYYRAAVAGYIQEKHYEKYNQRIHQPEFSDLPSYIIDTDIDWEDVARWFIEKKLINGLLYNWPNIPHQRIESITPLLAQAIRWQAEFFMATYFAKSKGSWSRDKYEEYGEQDPEEALQKYRALTEKVLQKFRELTEVPEMGNYITGHEVRVMEPVTYRGANKILAVLLIHDTYKKDLPYYRMGEVIYSTSQAAGPINKFIDAVKQSWSPHMRWTDQNGRVLYDNPEAQSAVASAQNGSE